MSATNESNSTSRRSGRKVIELRHAFIFAECDDGGIRLGVHKSRQRHSPTEHASCTMTVSDALRLLGALSSLIDVQQRAEQFNVAYLVAAD